MSLKYVVLTLINKNPQTGYDIVKSFDQTVGFFWSASHQQVYRELAALTAKKWITFKTHSQSDKPDKKVYRISAPGRAELKEWASGPTKEDTIRETQLVKMLNAELVGCTALRQQLKLQAKSTQDRLSVYLDIESASFNPTPGADATPDHHMLYLTLRRGILGCHSQLQWLQEADITLATIEKKDDR